MNIRSFALATTILAASTGLAFAQSTPSPANTQGSDVHKNVQGPTDMGATDQSNDKAKTGRGAMQQNQKKPMTTGSGAATQPANQSGSGPDNGNSIPSQTKSGK